MRISKMKLIILFVALSNLVVSTSWGFDFTRCIKSLKSLGKRSAQVELAPSHSAKVKGSSGGSVKSDPFVEVIDDLARLIIEAEDADSEEAKSVLLKQMIGDKDQQLVELLNQVGMTDDKKEHLQDLLALKIAILRQEGASLTDEALQTEVEARRAEKALTHGPDVELNRLEDVDIDSQVRSYDVGPHSDYLSVPFGGGAYRFHRILPDGSIAQERTQVDPSSGAIIQHVQFINDAAQFIVVKKFNKGSKTYISAHILDVKSGKLLRKKEAYIGMTANFIVTPKGKLIIVFKDDRRLRVYDLNSTVSSKRVLREAGDMLTDPSIKISRDGRYLGYFINVEKGTATFHFWDLESSGDSVLAKFWDGGKKIRVSMLPNDLNDFVIDSENGRLITLSLGIIRFYDLKTGVGSEGETVGDHYNKLQLIDDGRILVSANKGDVVAVNHRPSVDEKGKELLMINTDAYILHLNPDIPDDVHPKTVQVSPDGKWLAALYSDSVLTLKKKQGFLRIWHLPTGKLKVREEFGIFDVLGLIWSADSEYLSLKDRNHVLNWKKVEMP